MYMKARPIPSHAKMVHKGRIFEVWEWEQELFDGSTVTFETLSRPDTVAVVAALPNNNILLVRDEQPHREPVLTPAGGRIEEEEDPVEAANREFVEETGYSIGTLDYWFGYQPSDKVRNVVHFFVGRDLIKDHDPNPDAGEKIQLEEYSFDEFLALGQNPELRDTHLRIILLEAQLDPTKKEELYKKLYG